MSNKLLLVNLKITNLKIRIKVKNNFFNCVCSPLRINHPKNFCILKNNFIYTIFKYNKVNTINITKLKNKIEIYKSINNLLNIFDLSINTLKPYVYKNKRKLFIVDNISCFSFILNFTYSLKDLYQYIRKNVINTNLICSFKYSYLFKCITLSHKRFKGKLLLYKSGKFTILGVKNYKSLLKLKNYLVNFIYNYKNEYLRSL